MRFWKLAAIALSVVSGVAAGTPSAHAQSKEATLSGTWKYNAEKSRAEQKGEPADPSTREGYASGGRPRVGTGVTEPRGEGGGGGGGGRGAGAARGTEVGGAGGAMALGPLAIYTRPLPELVIGQNDSTITVSDPSGIARTYWLDGRKQAEPMLGREGETLETVAKWKGGKLTTERKLGTLGTIREVYSLRSGGRELAVEFRLTAAGLTQPIDQKRIYDAAAGH